MNAHIVYLKWATCYLKNVSDQVLFCIVILSAPKDPKQVLKNLVVYFLDPLIILTYSVSQE